MSIGNACGSRLFCVGNPSNIDLQSLAGDDEIEFEPPTWHTSVGHCQGYVDPEVQAERETQQGE